MSNQDLITIGKISGVFGLKGWVKVFSYTEPRQNILRYQQLKLSKGTANRSVIVVGGQLQGKNVVLQIEGISNRDDAQLLIGYDIAIAKNQLPVLGKNEYYWTDLIGLAVENLEGIQLGKIDYLLETGANDVLVVKCGQEERAIPFIQGQIVKSVDFTDRKMVVDWDADF